MITTVETLVAAYINSEYGWAVSEQFTSTFNGEDFEEQNDNALQYIRDAVRELLGSGLLSDTAYDELQGYYDNLEDYIVGGEE